MSKEIAMGKFIEVAKKSEIADQSAKCVEVEGKRIALFNLDGMFYAIDDTCAHEGVLWRRPLWLSRSLATSCGKVGALSGCPIAWRLQRLSQ